MARRWRRCRSRRHVVLRRHTCVTAPASVTIPAGLVSTTFQPAYGGTASLPCNAVVTATSSGLTSDTVTVTVNQQAGITMPGATTSRCFAGGVYGGNTWIGTAWRRDCHRSKQHSVARARGARYHNGRDRLDHHQCARQPVVCAVLRPWPRGRHRHGKCLCFRPELRRRHACSRRRPGGIEILSLNTETRRSPTDDTDWYVQVGLPCAGNTHLCTVQNVRSGGSRLSSSRWPGTGETPIARLRSDQPAATGQSVTKPIQPGIYYTQAIVGGLVYGLPSTPWRAVRPW